MLIYKSIQSLFQLNFFRIPAEKAGFEPAIRFWRIHAFQACLFSHSSISPHEKEAFFAKKRVQITNYLLHTNTIYEKFYSKFAFYLLNGCYLAYYKSVSSAFKVNASNRRKVL